MTENLTMRLLHGDALERLKELPDNSIDSVVTDPPYGLSKEPNIEEVLTKWISGESYDHGHGGFMGKSWDSFVPHPELWKEVHRVLKPGGHALVFAGTRTQDLMTIALRLAGFEVRDVIEWLYFNGFPKSHDISKAFDKREGAKREIIGTYKRPDGSSPRTNSIRPAIWGNADSNDPNITSPTTPLAKQWDGWGTALKPAHEPIIMVRKPIDSTVVDNVERYGVGGINIDECRVPFGEDEDLEKLAQRTGGIGSTKFANSVLTSEAKRGAYTPKESGRFPANCITLDDNQFYSKFFNITPQELSKKSSKKDRNSDWQGNEIELDSKGNIHPTVKPIDLMVWLVRLITPPSGTVLDPFAGSGSTLVAARREGFGFIGCELIDEYIPIIEARAGVKAE